MDDANLESEVACCLINLNFPLSSLTYKLYYLFHQFQQAMMIQPTGSVEQLYSPSYGSRASSSLSLNSSGNRSDLNVNFHSSLPVVYCSSQERLQGSKGNGRRGIHRPKWSSHDRLLSPLFSADIEALASKGKRQSPLEPAAAHRHYHSHLYTPKRIRKTEIGGEKPLAMAVNVERSASFSSTGMYRSSSDGVSRQAPAAAALVQQPPVAISDLNCDDMPVLPPQTTKDAITTSPDISQDLSTSLPFESEGSVTPPPPPVPYTEPPLFTPPAQDEMGAGSSSDTVTTDATFDYNDLTPPIEDGKGIGSHSDEDFDFSMPESPPPVSSLPPDEQTPSPEAPPIPLNSPPHEEAPPTSNDVPIADEKGEMSNGGPQSAESESQMQHYLTPRTALVKAFEDLDKIGESKLPDEDEPGDGEGEGREGEEEGKRETEKSLEADKKERSNVAVDIDDLYAKVDMTKKKRRDASEKQDEDVREGGSETGATFKPELVHKAASVEDIVGPDYAEVHHPKRSSMPSASSPAHSPTHSEPGYARIETVVSPPPGAKAAAASTEPHPPADQGRLYEVAATDTIGRRNQRSIRKLGIMFGPEFKNISGLQTQNKPQSIKVGTL